MNNYKNILIAVLLIIFAILIAFSLIMHRTSSRMVNSIEKIELHDTVIKFIPSKPLIITKMKTRIVKVSDSSIVMNPFIAKIDTVVLRDTIRAAFEFPQNLFSMQIYKKPDSVLVARTTLLKTVQKEHPWWETASYIIGGAFIGYLIGHR